MSQSQPMSETPHSQTPWQLSPQGYILPTHKSPYAMLKLKSPWVEGAWDDDPEAAANAVLIVEAVNSYASLKARIEALEGALRFIADGYENHNINHVDYRVRVYQVATEVLGAKND